MTPTVSIMIPTASIMIPTVSMIPAASIMIPAVSISFLVQMSLRVRSVLYTAYNHLHTRSNSQTQQSGAAPAKHRPQKSQSIDYTIVWLKPRSVWHTAYNFMCISVKSNSQTQQRGAAPTQQWPQKSRSIDYAIVSFMHVNIHNERPQSLLMLQQR